MFFKKTTNTAGMEHNFMATEDRDRVLSHHMVASVIYDDGTLRKR